MSQRLSDYSFVVRKERNHRFFSVLALVALVFTFIFLVKHTLFFSVRTRSISMSPDIPKNAFVLCTPILAGLSRGEVVLVKEKNTAPHSLVSFVLDGVVRFFTANQIQILHDKNDSSASESLRRLVGLPGDTIYMKGHVLFIKPKGEKHFLTEFEYEKKYNASIEALSNSWNDSLGLAADFPERVLDEGEYFVLADNRTSSFDSRVWQSLSKNEITARALVEFFPISHFQFF